MRRRRSERSITIDVDVNLNEFSTADLIEELKDRGDELADTPFLDDLANVRSAMLQGRTADALSLLERVMWPKWRTSDDCAKALLAAKKKTA